MPAIDARKIDLAVQLRRHARGWSAVANSLAAEFGWSSTIGHILNRGANQHGHTAVALCDLDLDVPTDAPARALEREPTDAARLMNENEHRRGRWRRLSPAPASTRAAALGYLGEAVELYSEAVRLTEGNRGHTARAQHRRLCRLADLLRIAWGAEVSSGAAEATGVEPPVDRAHRDA